MKPAELFSPAMVINNDIQCVLKKRLPFEASASVAYSNLNASTPK